MRNEREEQLSIRKNKDRTAALTVDDLRDPARPTCSVVQAATLLNIGKDAAYRMVESGRLPTVEISANHRRVSCASLLRLLDAGAAQ